jgi:enoyl-[acyl-carrier protein] reductase III
MINLEGKVALVTGSARGIGRACALKLAAAGADVVVNYVTAKGPAMEVAEEIQKMGRNAAVVRADVTERFDVDDMLAFVSKTFGRLDILVSNAATGGFRPLLASTDRNFEAAMNTNARALIYLMQASVKLLADKPERSKVVAISSHGSHMALPMYGMIGATKAALEALVRHLALELGGRNINFNVVKAGLVETDSTKNLPGSEMMFNGRIYKSMTGERMLEANDVAEAVLYLCSPLSDMVQGETLTVDGGAGIHV